MPNLIHSHRPRFKQYNSTHLGGIVFCLRKLVTREDDPGHKNHGQGYALLKSLTTTLQWKSTSSDQTAFKKGIVFFAKLSVWLTKHGQERTDDEVDKHGGPYQFGLVQDDEHGGCAVLNTEQNKGILDWERDGCDAHRAETFT